MLTRLPPVGHAVKLKRGDTVAAPIAAGYDAIFVQSGTAALALALQAAAKTAAVANPQVLIPAYACPDLVSAAVFSGVRPVLVDLEPDSTYMSLAALQRQICSSTVAIIAVNFLGIPERVKDIAALLQGKAIALIEDNAQWFPPPNSDLTGDYIVLSFGRGKPVSLLGGGVLLHRQAMDIPLPVTQTSEAGGRAAQANIVLRFILYNTLRKPLFYGVLERLPFLKLGATEYKALTHIHGMDSYCSTFLPANVHAHLQRGLTVQHQMRAMLRTLPALNFTDLSVRQNAVDKRLLRYPLLVESVAKKNDYLAQLRCLGVGGSALYGQTLPDIAGVNTLVDCPEGLENAESFASRLLTLPVHEQVTAKTIDRIYRCLKS